LELARRKEDSQPIAGEYDAGHTTIQLLNMSVYFFLNMRICKARFVFTQWKSFEDLPVPLTGGSHWRRVSYLAWAEGCISLVPVRGEFIRERLVPTCCLVSAAPCSGVRVCGLQDWAQLFISVCLLTKERLSQRKGLVLSQATDPHSLPCCWPAAEEV